MSERAGDLRRRSAARLQERGIALITAVLLLLLVSATAISSIDFSGQEFQAGGRARAAMKNLYAADSGVQLGLQRIQPPRNLTAFSFALSNGTVVESRSRSDAAPQDIAEAGVGKPPEGYAINLGAGFVNEIFLLNVTAVAPDRGLAEIEAKLGSLQPNSGTY